MVAEPYDVAAIGNYTKDTVVTGTGQRCVDGGGVRYSAFAAAGLGCRVAVVTRLAHEDRHVVDQLEAAGIDVYLVTTPSSTLMRLEYPSDNPDERTLVMAATAGSITPDQVRGVAAKAYLVSASVRGEISLDVIDELRIRSATIALDIQGYVRVRMEDGRLEHAPWPDRESVLSKVDIVKADGVEAEAVTGENDVERAARALADMGPREVVVTHRDGILVLANGHVHTAPFRPRQLVGRSGRGDTCLGSYTAMRLRLAPAEAILWSAAVTSLKMEADGPFQRSISEVQDLVAREYGTALEVPGR